MIVGRVGLRDMHMWTDGPKVVLDFFNFWIKSDFPNDVHLITVRDEYDIIEMIRRYSPVATYYVTGYSWNIEKLNRAFPNINFYDLEDWFD